MDATVVLLHSPLVGPGTWAGVAAELAARGHRVVVPDLRVAPAPPPWWPVAVESAAAPPAGTTEVVLVPHSNAGLLTPAVTERREARGVRVRACVFVDAALPGPSGTAPLGAPQLMPLLRELAVDGWLPPWTGWWDAEDVARLLPDPAVRRAVTAEEPRLPLAYFEQRVPVPAGWDARPCAYLWFGGAYDDDAARAVARGWPARRLPGGHLHALVDPAAVAGAVVDLAGLRG
ncbi:hypothetical protein [Georgenia sp. AZ-5]|uniref:hypothetical protein n=1 Tax=Georgenia sp. AZ-5 TaxID=3367526 RepID=UPI003754F85E